MNPLIKFLASPAGRIVRVVAGIALILWGILGLSGTVGIRFERYGRHHRGCCRGCTLAGWSV